MGLWGQCTKRGLQHPEIRMTNTRPGPRRKLRHLVRDWDKDKNMDRILDI